MSKKIGTNFEDRNRIREWSEAGKTAGEISNLVQVKEDAVQRCMDSLKPELTRGQKAAATRAANKAKAGEAEQEDVDNGTDR